MKFLAIFAAVCAVASASKGWTLTELSSAVASPVTEAVFKPVLEGALDHVLANIFTVENYGPVTVTTEPGVSGYYTQAQLEALLTPATNPVFIPHLENAYEQLTSAGGQTVAVMVPALDLTYMTLQEIDQALSSPATNPSLVPYLEYSLDHFMDALFAGHDVNAIVVAVPSGLGEIGGAALASVPSPVVVPVPVVPSPVVPSPVVPSPVVPAPVVPSPVVPAPVVPGPSAQASSPLVQIILNVRKSEDLEVSPVGAPVRPDGSQIGQLIDRPTPIQIAEQPIKPQPIQIVEQPIKPQPIQIVEQPFPSNPIDAIVLPVEALPTAPQQVVGPMI